MNIPAAPVIQSIPLVCPVPTTCCGTRDLFAILYIVSMGLMSLIVWLNDHAGFDKGISIVGDLD